MTLASRVASRFIVEAAESVVDRIRAIPGFERSKFLVSLLGQAERGRPLSQNQLAVLEKIEGERRPEPPREKVPANAVVLNKNLGGKDIDAIVHALWHGDDTITVVDSAKQITTQVLHSVVKSLASEMEGLAENWLELSADTDNYDDTSRYIGLARRAEDAAQALRGCRIGAKRNGNLVVMQLSPSFESILKRFDLENRQVGRYRK